MTNTITITSKDNHTNQRIVDLSLLLSEYMTDTITIRPDRVILNINDVIREMLSGIGEVDLEMREIEDAAIYDFLQSENEERD